MYSEIRLDFQKLILPMADVGVHLAGSLGNDEPQIDNKCIAFNGLDECGHPKNDDIFVPYPTDDARPGPGRDGNR
jgi:hypothetical protein